MSRTKLGLLAVIATVGLAAPTYAQAACSNTGATATCSLTGVNVTTTVENVVSMSIDVNSFGLTAPLVGDYSAGVATKTDAPAQTLTIAANNTWTLTVTGAAWTGTGNNAKSVGDLSWNVDGGATYTAMTTGPAATVKSGSATASTTAVMGYKTVWNLASDTPGTYTMALTYTITAP